MSEKEHRIIIKKRGGHGKGGHHGGAWKIAYADFMTAMMAFFLVMWLLSISSPKQLQGIAEYFRTPLAVAMAGGNKSSMSRSMIPGGGADPIEKKEAEVRKASQDAADSRRLADLKKHLEQLIEAKPELKQFRPQLLLELTPDGLRIQIIDSQKRPMFKLSSSVVEPYMRTILREIGPLLNELPNAITLSGHTDALQYHDGDRSYSNWELSADRANASRRELTAGGLRDNKVLRVTGVAAAMPFNRVDPADPANRRISVLVLNRKAQERIEDENRGPAERGLEVSNSAEDLQSLKDGEIRGTFNGPAAAGSPPSGTAPDAVPTRISPSGTTGSKAMAPQPPRPPETRGYRTPTVPTVPTVPLMPRFNEPDSTSSGTVEQPLAAASRAIQPAAQ